MNICSTSSHGLDLHGLWASTARQRPSHNRPACDHACGAFQLKGRPLREQRGVRRIQHRCGGRQQSHIARWNPFDAAWGTSINVDAQSVAAQLFASSIIPYAAFLYFLTRSKKTPGMALFGFYFLLVFVFATIPAGIYAKTKYGTILANVDYLHGSAESLLTVTNLLIVLGVRRAIREAEAKAESEEAEVPQQQQLEKESSCRDEHRLF